MRWTLFSWNVNGIRAAEKKGFLNWLAGTNADVVALQETKAQPEQLSKALINPDGYTAEWCSAEKKGYSGVCTYSKMRPLVVKAGLADNRFDHEGRVLITEYEPFVLANIYFPNGGRGPDKSLVPVWWPWTRMGGTQIGLSHSLPGDRQEVSGCW
jgi:exodeoxyribonuclease-3